MRLLLVEDDRILGDGLRLALSHHTYVVDWMIDGPSADQALKNNQYEAVVLDLGLPGKSGLDVLKGMRKRKDSTPVMILTARDSVNDRVLGLDTGADDFVVKPFDLDEVCARLRALQRRSNGRVAPLIEHRSIVLDPLSRSVNCLGNPVELTAREFDLLNFLLENISKVQSRVRIEETLYSWNEEVESNAVEVHIHHLRHKLYPELIRTVRGVGYVID